AMVLTFLHWGLHGWALYALVGVALGYFAYRRNLPLALRSALYPIFGERIHGRIGDMVDGFGILATLISMVTNLGIGALVVQSGLVYLFHIPDTPQVLVAIVLVMMVVATIGVVAGVEKGIAWLSNLNVRLLCLLLLFVLVTGPTLHLFDGLVQNTGDYLGAFVRKSFDMYLNDPKGREWMGSWTLFYWAWWIAWSPFVGMFIARISRGRTVREFILNVLLVPAGFTFLWMTVFGNTAIFLDMTSAAGAISQAVSADLSTALFHFLEQLPGAGFTSALAILLVAVFFVTSADSGALVIDTMASGGADDTPRWQRLYWCLLLGLVAALLLLAGGLGALQAATLVAALPFTIIMILISVGLVRQMNADVAGRTLETEGPPLAEQLKRILAPANRSQIERQIERSGVPALETVRAALEAEGLVAEVKRDETGLTLTAPTAHGPDFHYRLTAHERPRPALTALEAPERRRKMEWRLSARSDDAGRPRDVTGFTRDQLVADVLEHLQRWRTA
ncbi:MAG: BCCT family transporter, partial [Brevundimonas sp.]